LEPFNFTIVPNVVLEIEVSTNEEEVIVDDKLVVPNIISCQRNYQKDSQ